MRGKGVCSEMVTGRLLKLQRNIVTNIDLFSERNRRLLGTDLDEDELLDEKSSVDETTTGSVNSQMDVSITSRSSISSHGATGGIGSSASTSQVN